MALVAQVVEGEETAARPNVLLICIDDLRPQLGCYGEDYMHTPNLDRFAESAAVFDRHYVAVPTCGPSRACLLTGQHPQNDDWYENRVFESLPRGEDWQAHSLPGAFRAAGYTTVGIGKVSHNPSSRRYPKPTGKYDKGGNMTYAGPDDHEPELAHAWDRVGVPTGAWEDPWGAFFGYEGGATRSYKLPKSPPVEAADVPDTGYPDGLIAEEAVRELLELKDAPFFLAVGFYKPHLPFCAPKKYWDHYDRDKLPLAPYPGIPANIDERLSLHPNGELTGRYDALADRHEATEAEARRLRHGYFAAVSYVDAQVGKVLNELDRLGLSDNTIVVVWGDHGWHLGDSHVWGKHTAFEWSLRSALLMRVPGAAAAGKHINGIVESVDLFPTLIDYCGVETPAALAGRSLRSLMDDPTAPGKDAAWGFWDRGKHKALSMRTDRYRITRWTDPDGTTAQVDLYDHENDPHETRNIAGEEAALVEELLKDMPPAP
jgi:arylsulfatase A-like enzyme